MKALLTSGLILAATQALATTDDAGAEPNSQDSGVYLALRQAFYNSDDERVREYLDIQLKIDPENPTLLEEAVLSAFYGLETGLAADYAERLKPHKPNSIALEVAEFTNLLKNSQFGEAKTYLENAKTLDFFNAEIIQAWEMALAGDPTQATALLERVASEQGELSFVFDYQRAMIEANINQNYQLAADILANKGTAIYLSDLDYYSHLALLKLADSPTFDVLMEEGYGERELWPGFIADLVEKTEQGKIDASLDFASPQNALAAYVNALVVSGQGLKLEYGVERLLRGISPNLSPESAWVLREYMQYFYSRGEYDDVVKFAEMTDADSFLYSPNDQLRVNAEFELERKDEVEAWAKKPPREFADELAFKGDVFRRLEDYAQAVEYYEQALDIAGRDSKRMVWAVYGLAISYERLDMWDKAEPNFRKAIELEPESADMLNYLGYSYVDRGENLAEGLDMIEKAVELSPDQGHIIDSLGWAYFRMGRFEDALEPLEEASSLMSTDPTVNAHLGDLYWELGREREAYYQWERASRFLEKDSKDLTQQELDDRLENGL